MVELLRDNGLAALVAGDPVETIADGLQFTEGPLWLPDGALLFQDIKAERTYRLEPGGKPTVVREQTGAANGQTFLPDGRIVFCEQNGRRVSAMRPDGSGVTTLAETWQGRRLNSPNDVVCRSDGLVVFTDPPYGLPSPEAREIPFQGVYALRPDGAAEPWLDDFEKPNGLAFAPDERTLYVCDTARYHLRAFELGDDGRLVPDSGRVLFVFDPGSNGGPDGMKVDRDGRLYVAVALGIWVLEPSGDLLGIIALPNRPANLAWCGPDASILAITAGDRLYQVRLNVQGLPPRFQPGIG